jgi:hypothetical protein
VAEPEGWRAKRVADEENRGKARKKGHETSLGEAKLSEQKEYRAAKAVLSRCQTERGGKAFWDAEQLDHDWASRWSKGIASQSLLPREASVGSLGAGKDLFRFAGRSYGGRRRAHLDALVSHELHTGLPLLSAAGVAPEQRRGTTPERMQQDTDPTRLRGGFPIPLTLRTLWAAATIADPGAVEHAQAAIGLLALLSWAQGLARRTGQRPIGLKSEVLPGEPLGFPGQGDRRLLIALNRRLLGCGLCEGGSKLRRAQRRRLKRMPQFQEPRSRPIVRQSARLLVQPGHANTSGQDLAPGLHRQAAVQRRHKAS